MEASATTLNISSPIAQGTASAINEDHQEKSIAVGTLPKKKPLRHSDFHGPNFGRYVAGCTACEAKYPNGPGTVPVNKQRMRNDTRVGQLATATAAVGAASEMTANIAKQSADTIAALMDQIDKLKRGEITPQGAQAKGVDSLVELMLRKEGRAIEKEELELKRIQAGRVEMLRVEQEREAQTAAMQSHCTHTKENGITSICQQQIHNDGMVHPFCQRCFKTWPARQPSRQ